ncbi:MAG: alpha/beta hydrolase [Bdellovibrionaceae bacterium]|nr:alpha/beta hydrolase [Pseudobdellovibrionaceae bacterium]
MKIHVLFSTTCLLVLVGASGAWAQKACFQVGLENVRVKAGESFLKLSGEKTVSFEFVRPVKADHPTLVFLPGIFRGMEQKDPAVQALLKEGFGSLRTTTSDHWESLKGLEGAEGRATRVDPLGPGYARETQRLVNELGAEPAVAISLSYSSVVLANMGGRRIFVAPLVKASDSDPAAAAALRHWEMLMGMNPFMGSSLIRSNRDSNYRSFWSGIVNANLRANPDAYGKGTDRQLVIESYMRLSRSTEDFNLVDAMAKTEGPVDFVLAEKESKVALSGQVEAAVTAAKRVPVRLILVRGAEHNVPDSQPAAYHTAIRELAMHDAEPGLRVGVIDPRVNPAEIRWLSATEALRVTNALRELPESTVAADLSGLLGP